MIGACRCGLISGVGHQAGELAFLVVANGVCGGAVVPPPGWCWLWHL